MVQVHLVGPGLNEQKKVELYHIYINSLLCALDCGWNATSQLTFLQWLTITWNCKPNGAFLSGYFIPAMERKLLFPDSSQRIRYPRMYKAALTLCFMLKSLDAALSSDSIFLFRTGQGYAEWKLEAIASTEN